MKKLMSNLTNRNHLRYAWLLMLLFAGSFIHAQTTVTGVVSDDKGMTIPGASVMVKGTKDGVSTNLDGKYEISVPANGALTFSFIGFESQTINVNGRKTINASLKESVERLDEIVVIGYGTQKRNDINSSISTVKAKDLENIKQVSIDQMLQGKAAGVKVTNGSGQPGGASSIRVRGTTSISGTNEPLYIVDGVPISGDSRNIATSGRPVAGNDFSANGGAGNAALSPVSSINPNDIESIDILKDASATGIYGSRGANGVIIITTKSGKKGNGKISYEGYTSVSSIYKKLDVLNLREYAQLQNDLAAAFGNEPRAEFAHPELLGEGTDWQDEIYRTAMGKSHQLSFSGGKESTGYYLSAGFLDQEGTILNSGLKRYTMRLNLDSKVKDWFRIGANVSTGITNEKVTINQSYTGLIQNTLLQAPDVPVKDVNGQYAAPPPGQNAAYFNPVAEALTKDNSVQRKNFLGSLFAEANLLKGLKYRFEVSANTEFSENTEFSPSFNRGSQFNLTADLIERRQNWYSTNIKNLLTYDLAYKKHKLTVMAGHEANDSHWQGIIAMASGFQTNDIYSLSLSDPDGRTVEDYKGSAGLWSYFARAFYEFNDKYSVSGSYRRDTSSKFDPVAEGHRQRGDFGTVTVGYKLSNEKFMESTKKHIDNIKFRFGYGTTGNQQIPNNRYGSVLSQQNSGLGQGFLVGNFPNPDLKWESMYQTNLGMDFTVLDSRLAVAVDAYNKTSKDFLNQVPLPGYITGDLPGENGQYGGIGSPWSNLGKMENKGYEITLSYNTKGTGNFSWNSSLVFSAYKNKLVSIQDGLPLTQDVNTNGYQPVTVTNTKVGEPIGMFWGYETEGIFNDVNALNSAPLQFGQTVGTAPGQTYLGDIRYKDVNGDGKIDINDKTFIGNPHPDFTYGFTNNFRYKSFDLSVFLQGSQGNDVMNLTKRAGTTNAQLYVNQLSGSQDYWTPENTGAAYPRPIGSTSNHNIEISDRYVEDGSYLRIQNVTIGYSLPQDLIGKIKLSRVRLYATAQNLHTFTDYSGYDPEIGDFNQNPLLSGIDNGRYPSPRTYSFGVNVEF